MGIHAVAFPFGGVVGSFAAWGVFADSAPGVTATAQITVNTDGSVGLAAIDNDLSSPGSEAWYLPLTSSIGDNYWVRFTATSGAFTTNEASSFTALTAGRSATKSATTGSAQVTFTIDIATDSGGSNIVFTSTGNQLQYTHT